MTAPPDRETLSAADDVTEWRNADSSVAGYVTFQISGTWVGTITFQGYVRDSALPVAVVAEQMSTDGTKATTTTANGIFRVDASALGGVRCKMSAYTSGDADVDKNEVIG